MSRRILYIIDSLKIGGAEMLLLGLLDAVKARGDTAHVAYFTPGPLEAEVTKRGVPLTRLSRKGLKDPRAFWRTYKLMRDWKPDIVHTHLVKSDLAGQIAARLRGLPRLMTLHNTDPWRVKPMMSAAYRAATAGADACIAVSDRVADHVGKTKGYPRDKITTIVNGIDLDHFTPTQPPLDLSPYGVPDDAFVVSVIGSLTPQKDHDNFVKAAAILAAQDPRPYFLIVGDGPLRDEIAAKIDKLGDIGKRIILTGPITQMAELLAATDLQVISSGWEGLPMTLLEGMAMERPVASTAVGGIPDCVTDGQTGVLVPATDAAALAAAMADLLGDPAKCKRLGKAARQTIVKTYGSGAMQHRLFEIYDALVSPSVVASGATKRVLPTS